MKKRFYYFLIFFGGLLGSLQAQEINYQQKFLQGKSYFKMQQYDAAEKSLQYVLPRSEQNPFMLHAAFFYAICEYQLGHPAVATKMFRELHDDFPKWENADEVRLWLGKLYWEQEKPEKALSTWSSVKRDSSKDYLRKLEYGFLAQVDSVHQLQDMLERHPYDSLVAKALAYKIAAQPVVDRNQELLEFLVNEFHLSKQRFAYLDRTSSKKKSSYNVGVLMPFMLGNLDTSPGQKSNQFVLDMYQGMQMAQERLASENINLKLKAYDTHADSVTTARFLKDPELQQLDMMIGPLYPKPSHLANQFSEQHHIIDVNPLSSNSAVIGTNPYAFLFKTSVESQGRIAANFASKQYGQRDHDVFIFYGTRKEDSIFAYQYRKTIEADSFHVAWMRKLTTPEEAKDVLDQLTRVAKDTATEWVKGQVYVANPDKVKVGDEDVLLIPKDSIGHIVLASNDNLTVSSIISAVETRRDSIPLIGFDDWMDYKQISLDQFARLNIVMLGNNYFDYTKPKVREFKKEYQERYNALPSYFSYVGYECLMFYGKMLHEYGNQFQFGLYGQGFQPGEFFYGFDYSNANDNQALPIIQLEGSDLKILNK